MLEVKILAIIYVSASRIIFSNGLPYIPGAPWNENNDSSSNSIRV
jgi:hypothetical protein